MTYKNHIRYHKWQEKDYKELFNSVREQLEMKSLQFYMPFYSLYFNIHNSKKSLYKIDLERNYYLKNIKGITKSRYYNSNMFLVSDIYDSSKNIIQEKEIFCKTIPIVDTIHCVNDNYNFVTKKNYHLPSAYNYNTFKKINDMNNTAYIDVFCSYLFGNLTYALYLLHVPFQIIILIIFNHYNLDNMIFLEHYFFVSFFLILILLSSITYKFYEKPANDEIRRKFKK